MRRKQEREEDKKRRNEEQQDRVPRIAQTATPAAAICAPVATTSNQPTVGKNKRKKLDVIQVASNTRVGELDDFGKLPAGLAKVSLTKNPKPSPASHVNSL